VDRRRFLLTSVAGALAVPLGVQAQPRPVPRVGILTAFASSDLSQFLQPFRHELRKLGWIEGQTVTILPPRSAEGRNERLPELAAEVLKADPQVIVVFSAPATRVLQQATASVPIVMWAVGDPVEYGLVASLARPGGNVTGASYLVNEVAGKLVELLKEAVPAVGSVAVLVNPGNPGGVPYVRAVRVTGQALGVRVQAVEIRTPDDLDGAFAAIAQERAEAIILPPEPLIRSQRGRVAEFAAGRRLPVLVHGTPTLLASGLLSYAAKASEYPRIVASYVHRLLKGAKPADLPIHQPTEFELGVNLKTAKALGLTIPPSLLVRADQVIE
jgi:putative tryptophan/tyrosine transport system substrate-binding protein